MPEIILPHNFKERDYQIPALRALDGEEFLRFYLLWHRRAGKDFMLWSWFAGRAMKVVGAHYYLLPTYTQAKRIIWDGFTNDGRRFLDQIPKEIIKGKPNESELNIELVNGSFIQLIGTDKFDSIRGSNPKTTVFSEFGFHNPMAWEVVKPILKLNGGMAVFDTTPNGENHAKELWDMAVKNPKWFTQKLTIEDTKLLTMGDMDEERAEGASEDFLQQEYYCSFDASAAGAYFGDEMRAMENRIGFFPWEELRKVDTYWDLGISGEDHTTIIFTQMNGFIPVIIDSYENSSKGFEHYAKILKDKPYSYGTHYLPHDAKNKERGTGREQYKTFSALVRDPVEVLPRPKLIKDKLDSIRWLLKKLCINKETCNQVTNALKSYQREYDEEKKKFNDSPLHNWASHYTDAVAYFALNLRNGIPEVAMAGNTDFNLLPDYDDSSGVKF